MGKASFVQFYSIESFVSFELSCLIANMRFVALALFFGAVLADQSSVVILKHGDGNIVSIRQFIL